MGPGKVGNVRAPRGIGWPLMGLVADPVVVEDYDVVVFDPICVFAKLVFSALAACRW